MTTGLTEPIIGVVARDLPPPRRSRLALVGCIVALAFMATGLAYLWLNCGDQIRSAGSGTPPSVTTAPVMAAGEDTLGRGDFDKFKLQNDDSLRATAEALDAQKAALKTLSDQVAALSAKLDTLRGAATSAKAQTSVAPAATPAVPLRRPAIIAQRKKPAAPKPVGPISVGGAPLPASPDQ